MTALVTGASGGIGSAAALALAHDGFDIALQYNSSAESAQRTAEDIRALGRRAEVFRADVADSGQVRDMLEAAEVLLGGVDVLVNNAGVSEVGLLSDMEPERWQRLMDVDLTGVYNCCRAAIPAMVRRQSGVIINISSIWGMCGASCEAAYSAAKAGVIGLTQALAQELGPSGIRVNCVAPGVIDTPMNSRFSEDDMAELADRAALCRIGRPEEVADAIAFLASERASFITGAVLPVTGGFR